MSDTEMIRTESLTEDGSLFVRIVSELMSTIAPNFGSIKVLANCSMICKSIHINRQAFTPIDSPTSFLHDERLVMAAVMGHTVHVRFMTNNTTNPVLRGVRFQNERILPSFADTSIEQGVTIFYTEAMTLEKAMYVYKLDFKPSDNPRDKRDYVIPSVIAKALPCKMIPYSDSWARALHVNLHGGVEYNSWSKCFYRVLATSMIDHGEFDRETGDIKLGSWTAGINKSIADMQCRKECYLSILKEILAGEKLLPAETYSLSNDTVLQHYLQTGHLLKTGKFPTPFIGFGERRMPEHKARTEIKSRMRFSHTSPDNLFSLRHLVEHVLYKCSLRTHGVCNVRELRTNRIKTRTRYESDKSVTEILGCGGKNSPLELRWLAGSMGSVQQEISVFHNIDSIRSSSKMVTGRRIIDSLLEMMHEFKLALLEVQVHDENSRVIGRDRVRQAIEKLELQRDLYEAVQLRYLEFEEFDVEFDDTGNAMFPGLRIESVDFFRAELGEWCNLFVDERLRRDQLELVKKIWTQVYSRLWPQFMAKTHDDFHICPKNHREMDCVHRV